MSDNKRADFIIYNVSVITMNPDTPMAYGVAITDKKFIGLLDKNDKYKWSLAPNGQYIDGQGMTLLPGFIDAHFHLKAQISKLFSIDSSKHKVSSIGEIIQLIKNHANTLQKETWIRAVNYDPFYLKENRHPTRWDLDKATSKHPIRLRHVTRHVSVLNSKGLKQAGISRHTVDPPGVNVERDLRTNIPTGVIFGGDAWLSKHIVPPLDKTYFNQGVHHLKTLLLSNGIIALQDATPTNTTSDLQFWSNKVEEGWPIKIQLMTEIDNHEQMASFLQHELPNTSTIQMGPVKVIMESYPQLQPGIEELTYIAIKASERGTPLAIHVVEPEMVTIALEAIKQADPLLKKEINHRFEHLSLCPDAFLPDIADLGISIVTNPSLLHDHGDRYFTNVHPSEHDWLYRMNSLKKSGIQLAAGSDAPVASLNPFIGIQTACTRSTLSGNILGINEKLDRVQALELYTTGAAKVAGWDRSLGMIYPGYDASFILVDNNPLTCPDQLLANIQVFQTWINGELVYKK